MTKDTTTEMASDESIRACLKETLEHLTAAGHSTHDLVEFTLNKTRRAKTLSVARAYAVCPWSISRIAWWEF